MNIHVFSSRAFISSAYPASELKTHVCQVDVRLRTPSLVGTKPTRTGIMRPSVAFYRSERLVNQFSYTIWRDVRGGLVRLRRLLRTHISFRRRANPPHGNRYNGCGGPKPMQGAREKDICLCIHFEPGSQLCDEVRLNKFFLR